MTFLEKINAFFMSDTYAVIGIVFWSIVLLLCFVTLIYDFFNRKKVSPDELFIQNLVCFRLDKLLKMHNVDSYEGVFESPLKSTRDVLNEINEKLDVLLSGPMDKVTIEELNSQRESQLNSADFFNKISCRLEKPPMTCSQIDSLLHKKVLDSPTRIILNITYFTSYVEDEADIENIIFVAPKEYSFDSVLTIALEYFHTVLKLCGHFESINIYYSESLPEETCIPVYDIDKCEEEMKPARHCLKGGPNCPFWNGKEPCEKCVAEPLTKSKKCPIAPDCPFWDEGINCTMSSCILGDYIDFPGRLPKYRLNCEDKPDEV